MANLTSSQIKDSYQSVLTTSETTSDPTTGTLQNGKGTAITTLTVSGTVNATTLAVTGNATFDTNTLFVNASNDRVGIGTIVPEAKLTVNGNIAATTSDFLAPSTGGAVFMFQDNNDYASIWAVKDYNGDWANLTLCRIGGNVGIRTATPAVPLDVVGNIRSSTGILFGSDTAAANALDDYEEGTWSMGIAFGGNAVGVTYSNSTGTYTKIGRQVTVNGLLELSSKGSSSGLAQITGLPFTIANTFSNYSAPSLRFNNIAFLNQFQAYGNIGGTTIVLTEITALGIETTITNTEFANNSEIMVSFTYFV